MPPDPGLQLLGCRQPHGTACNTNTGLSVSTGANGSAFHKLTQSCSDSEAEAILVSVFTVEENHGRSVDVTLKTLYLREPALTGGLPWEAQS